MVGDSGEHLGENARRWLAAGEPVLGAVLSLRSQERLGVSILTPLAAQAIEVWLQDGVNAAAVNEFGSRYSKSKDTVSSYYEVGPHLTEQMEAARVSLAKALQTQEPTQP